MCPLNGLFPDIFQIKILDAFLIFPVLATCPTILYFLICQS
jgi:hypothetical protein